MDQPKRTPRGEETSRSTTPNEVALAALELGRMALALVAKSATVATGESVIEAPATRRTPTWFELELDLDAPDDSRV